MNNNRAFNKIKQAWNENPLQVIMIGTAAALAAAKLLDATTSYRNASVYAREIARRERMLSYK